MSGGVYDVMRYAVSWCGFPHPLRGYPDEAATVTAARELLATDGDLEAVTVVHPDGSCLFFWNWVDGEIPLPRRHDGNHENTEAHHP